MIRSKRNVLDTAYEWMKTCDASHEMCVPCNTDSVPTRLISVSGEVIRLECTETWTQSPPYATLSYCWGDLDFLTTTTSALEEFLIKIPVERLPQTFKDAIQIVRALDIDYIWIDSLCIVQDSNADWRKESSRMSEVYGSSYINIAASSAANPGEGCFTKPQFFCDNVEAKVTVAGKEYECWFYHIGNSYTSAVERSHLMSRAWAVQEKLLPTRSIHFGNRGAFWECRSSVGLERLPNLFEGAVSGLSLASLTHNLADNADPDLYQRWKRVVTAYSIANLTLSRDKLPGLAGIARHFGNHKECEYLAGMWRDATFDAQLCWCIFGPQARPEWRAPSWSWASVNGSASFYPFEPAKLKLPRIVCARTLQASVAQVNGDAYGEVSGGWIRIACSHILSGKIGMVASQPTIIFRLQHGACNPVSISLDCTNDTDTEGSGKIYVLPIFTTSVSSMQTNVSTQHEDARGLVLQKTGGALGEFRRVGFFRCSTKIYDGDLVHEGADGKKVWNEFIELLRQQGVVTAREVCTEVIDDQEHGTGGFVITVV
jgi:hypothetical protein